MDHPRMRGEDSTVKETVNYVEGSPPHARGRQMQSRANFAADGITPACAGKTCRRARSGVPHTDHPRMRGEDALPAVGGVAVVGSPPHARGRRRRCSRGCPRLGITPACAGKTCAQPRVREGRSDHPRMRGEDAVRRSTPSSPNGSPPHARGRHEPLVAGNIDSLDHPRMRGEDSVAKSARRCIWGSPPHARGRRPRKRVWRTGGGITPACAGKT